MGECGVRLFTDCLAGMDDPAKWDWWRKIETRASSLAGGLLLLRPIRPATASKLLFIRADLCHLTQSLPLFRPSGQPWVALSRIRPDARLWFIFPSNRTALMGCSELFLRFLLKLEGEKSAGLRQLSLQDAYGGGM